MADVDFDTLSDSILDEAGAPDSEAGVQEKGSESQAGDTQKKDADWETRYKHLVGKIDEQGQELGDLRKFKQKVTGADEGDAEVRKRFKESLESDPYGTIANVLDKYDEQSRTELDKRFTALLEDRDEKAMYTEKAFKMFEDLNDKNSEMYKKTVAVGAELVKRHPEMKNAPDLHYNAALVANTLLQKGKKVESNKDKQSDKPPNPPSGSRKPSGAPVTSEDKLKELRSSRGNTDILAQMLEEREKGG